MFTSVDFLSTSNRPKRIWVFLHKTNSCFFPSTCQCVGNVGGDVAQSAFKFKHISLSRLPTDLHSLIFSKTDFSNSKFFSEAPEIQRSKTISLCPNTALISLWIPYPWTPQRGPSPMAREGAAPAAIRQKVRAVKAENADHMTSTRAPVCFEGYLMVNKG